MTLESEELLQAQNFTLNIANGAEAIYTLNGKRGAGRFDPREWAVSAEILIPMENATQLKRSWGSEAATTPGNTVFEGDMTMELTSEYEIGSSGDYYGMTITFPRAVWSGYVRQADSPEATVQEVLTIAPLVDSGTDIDIEIEITNADASYPDAS